MSCTCTTRHGHVNYLAVNLDDELSVWIYNGVIDRDCEFMFGRETLPKQRSFALIYYLSTPAIRVVHPDEENFSVNRLWNTVFVSSDKSWNEIIVGGVEYKFLVLCIGAAWLEKQGQHLPANQRDFISRVIATQNGVFLLESFDPFEKQMT